MGISNTEKASSSDISDEGDERLSHAVDKKEIIGTIKKYEYLFVERR